MPQTSVRTRYFLTVNVVLLGLVVVGFAPSFFLRPFISEPHAYYPDGLSPLYVVHGLVMLGWYGLMVVQAGLVRMGRTDTHRRLGRAGAWLAGAAVVITLATVAAFPKRIHALAERTGRSVDDIEPGLAELLWIDLVMIALFSVFVALALRHRNVPERHRRYMLYAGFAFIFAATARMAGMAGEVVGGGLSTVLHVALLLGLTGSVLWHDRRSLGRITRTGRQCFLAYWGGTVLAMIIAATDAGDWLEALLR